MSTATQRLDEIAARLKAATRPHKHRPVLRPLTCLECNEIATAELAILAHTPADMSWLIGLVRGVCEDECAQLERVGSRCEDSSREVFEWCWTCRMRHYVRLELEVARCGS